MTLQRRLSWAAAALAVVAVLGLLGAGVVAVRGAISSVGSLSPPKRPVPPLASLHLSMSLRDVRFITADGFVIRGWYADPRNGAVVVIGHGWSDTRASMLPEAEMLSSAKFGVLLFDWRGHGESDGNRTTWGEKEQADLSAALSWIQTESPGVSIGALGFSMGGMTTVLEAAGDPRIAAVVLEGTFPTLEDVAYQLQSSHGDLTGLPAIWALRLFGPDLAAVRPVDRLCAIAPRPLLLIYGSEEHAVRFDLTARMSGAACQPEDLWIVNGAKHGAYARTDPDGLRTKLVGFFERALLQPRNDAAPASSHTDPIVGAVVTPLR